VIATRRLEPLHGSLPSFWQAPSAVTPSIHEAPYHGATHAGPGVCELAHHGLPALVGEWGHTVEWISPAEDSVGEVFLSCLDTEYYLHGWPLQTGILLDARYPGRTLGPIPGARPVAGQPETVDLETKSAIAQGLSARRDGNA
jgi:hypothetical protein